MDNRLLDAASCSARWPGFFLAAFSLTSPAGIAVSTHPSRPPGLSRGTLPRVSPA